MTHVQTAALLLLACIPAPLAAQLDGIVVHELAGRPAARPPFLETVRAFNAGESVWASVDTERYPELAGLVVDVYAVAAQDAAGWRSDPRLQDAGGGPETVLLEPGGTARNALVVDAGGLAALGPAPFTALGLGYDLVLDVDRDGLLSPGDHLDGGGGTAGFYVVRDTTLPGPFEVVELLYSGPGAFLGQNLFFPASVAELGALPLVTVSHGGGQDYQYYDHIGLHLASYGCVVMSHQNNVSPGIVTAAESTLANLEYFLGNLDAIAGGALQGHVDASRMTWIGHSRGGEGVVLLHQMLRLGSWTTPAFAVEDVRLISSIAPTDFTIPKPLGVAYHMWAGSADCQMTCADCSYCGVYRLHDRADWTRQAITLHGAGHNDFHTGSGGGGCGPCLLYQDVVHQVMRGYLLPLVAFHIQGSAPAEDFLWRQWESFRPLGAPDNPCLKVDLMYRPVGPEKRVLDDFQSSFATDVASSGCRVQASVDGLVEGLLEDGNRTFTHDALDPMNGMVMARPGDTTRGAVFSFDGDAGIAYTLTEELSDLSRHTWLSLRACQATRHPLTLAEDGDTRFAIELVDAAGRRSALPIAVHAGGVEEPYPRIGCGEGVGWFNQFETLRVRLADFAVGESRLDLSRIESLALLFGPSHGTPMGRIGLDDLELLAE